MRIALIQMTIETGRRSANLVRALDWIDKACELDKTSAVLLKAAGISEFRAEGWDALERIYQIPVLEPSFRMMI